MSHNYGKFTKYDHLNFIVPPECHGQIVETSFAIDGEQVVCRTFDASDQTTSYAVTSLDNLSGEFESWNRRPVFADDGLWSACS